MDKMKDIIGGYLKNAGVSNEEIESFNTLYDEQVSAAIKEEASRQHAESAKAENEQRIDIAEMARKANITN